MLNVKNTMTDSLSSTMNDWYNRAYTAGSQAAGRAVAEFKKIPAGMQGDVRVATGVIFAANAAFFAITNTFANWIDRRIENHANELDADQKKFKNFLVNGVVVGGSTYIFNVVISKLTQYELSNTVKIAIAAAAIAARILLNRKPVDNENAVDAGAGVGADTEQADAVAGAEQTEVAVADAADAEQTEVAVADAAGAEQTNAADAAAAGAEQTDAADVAAAVAEQTDAADVAAAVAEQTDAADVAAAGAEQADDADAAAAGAEQADDAAADAEQADAADAAENAKKN